MRSHAAWLSVLVAAILFPLTPVAAQAPPLEATLRLDRTEVTVGDRVSATLIVRHREGVRIEPVEIGRELGSFLVDGVREPQSATLESGGGEVRFRFDLTVFRPGRHVVPPLPVHGIDGPTGTPVEAATAPVEVTVVSILEATGSELADIKDPFDLPGGLGLWPWALVLLGAAAAGLLWLWRRARRHPAPAAAAAPVPEIPAHEWALGRLQELNASGFLQRGEVKRFFIELSEIHKEYLHRRFGILTLERTTDELVHSLRFTRVSAVAVQGTRELLSGCDLVKFARFRPTSEAIRSQIELAFRLIEETRPREAKAAAPEASEPIRNRPATGVKT